MCGRHLVAAAGNWKFNNMATWAICIEHEYHTCLLPTPYINTETTVIDLTFMVTLTVNQIYTAQSFRLPLYSLI